MENDLISRHAAIELIERMKPYHQEADDIAEMIANMPSAQPERKTDCAGCKHGRFGDAACAKCVRAFTDMYEEERDD